MTDRPDLDLAHSERFRKVSDRYPHLVAFAYGLDLERAARATDEEVAATVGAWERAQGLAPTDWHAVGAYERDELDLDDLDPDRLPAGFLDRESDQ